MLPREDPQDEFRLLLRLQGGWDNHIDTRYQVEVMSHFPLIKEDLVLVHRLMSGEETWGQLSVAFLVLLREETEEKCVLHQLNKGTKGTWRIHRHGIDSLPSHLRFFLQHKQITGPKGLSLLPGHGSSHYTLPLPNVNMTKNRSSCNLINNIIVLARNSSKYWEREKAPVRVATAKVISILAEMTAGKNFSRDCSSLARTPLLSHRYHTLCPQLVLCTRDLVAEGFSEHL